MMNEMRKVKYSRSLMPKCPNCHKELGREIDGIVFPYRFLEQCSCGQKLLWKEKKQKCREHFAKLIDNSAIFSGKRTVVFLKGENLIEAV